MSGDINGSYWDPIAAGVQGVTGETGPEGATGAQGPQGPTGATGPGSAYNARFATSNWWGMPGVMITGNQGINFLGASTAYYQPILVEKTITVTSVYVNVQNAGGAGAEGRISIYAASESDFQPGALIADVGTVAVATTGDKTITGLSVTLSPGLYHMRYQTDANATRPQFRGQRGFIARGTIPMGGTDQYRFTADVSRTYGAAENPGTAFGAGGGTSSGIFCYWVRMKWDVT